MKKENNNKKIEVLHTPCKNCIGAVYEKTTQTDCRFDQLKNFDSVIEVRDDESEFYVINNKRCIYYREKDWLEKKDIKIDKALETIVEENTIKYIAIINIDEVDTLDKIQKVISNLQKQDEKPCGIVFMMQKSKSYDVSVNEIINQGQESGFAWKIKNFIEDYDLYRYVKAIIQSAPRKRLYLLVNNTDIPKKFYGKILKYNLSNRPISAININDNVFFSFAAVAYTIQLLKKNLLEDKSLQKKYENI